MRSTLARNTRHMSVAYLVGYASQALYFLVLARRLGPAGLGLFAGGLAIVSIIAPFAGLGSGQVLLMQVSRDPARFREQYGDALRAIAIHGGGLAGVVAAVGLLLMGGGALGPVLASLAFAELVCGRVNDLSSQCFQAHDSVGRAGAITAWVSIVRVVVVAVWLVLPVAHSADSWSVFYLATGVVCAAGATAAVIRRYGSPRRSGRRLLAHAGIGIGFSVGTASKTIYADIDKAMLSRMRSSGAAGIYTAAYRIVYLAYAPVLAFLYSSNTRFFRAGTRGAVPVWRIVRSGLPATVAYGLCAGAALFACAPLMPLVLGGRYASSAVALQWLCALPAVMAMHSILGDAMMGMGRQGLRSVLQVGTAAVNVGLNLWLIPLASWRGATIATYGCELALALALGVALRREVRHERAAAVAVEPGRLVEAIGGAR